MSGRLRGWMLLQRDLEQMVGEQLCRNTSCAWNWGEGSIKSLEVAGAGQGLEGALGRLALVGGQGRGCSFCSISIKRSRSCVTPSRKQCLEGVQGWPQDSTPAPAGGTSGAPHGAHPQPGKQNFCRCICNLMLFHEIFIIPF